MSFEINPRLEAINATKPKDGLCKLCTHIVGRIYEDPATNWFSFPRYDRPLAANPEQADISIIANLAELGCPLCSMVWKLFRESVRNHYGPDPEDWTVYRDSMDELLDPPPEQFDFDAYIRWVVRQTPRLRVGLSLKTNLDPPVYAIDYNFRDIEATGVAIEQVHPSVATEFYVPDHPRDESALDIQISLVSMKTIPPGIFLNSRPQAPSTSTDSESSWTQCSSWLNQCLEEHESCNRRNAAEYTLPTRLIDVGDEFNPPRICTSDNLAPDSKYVTLSHCWGKQKKVTLNKDTLGPFQTCIPSEALSNTFNQAITVVRRLRKRYGVKYLWIDSLCILQDNLDDWRQVAGTMADIYGNCWCNIAATKAPDGRSGLFGARDSNLVQPLVIQAPDSEKYICVHADRWTECIDNAPLNQRAWVIQERLLSRRILHFAQDEIFFECQAGRASETFPQGELVANDFTTDGVKDVLLGPLGRDIASLPPWNEVWTTIIETVADGNLSFDGDKLIAFAGAAKRFQQIYDCGEYLAGLWKKDLDRQLVWKTRYGTDDLNELQARKSKIPRAPSWSWTALEADIDGEWAPLESESLITVIDASVTATHGDPFSEVKDGELRIRCRLLLGDYDAQAPRGREILFDLHGEVRKLFFYPDVKFESGQKKCAVYCVPVFTIQGDDMCIQGLVLEPTGLARGQFRRIGTFEDLIEDEINVLKHGISAGIDEYESSQGYGWYTISII